MHFVMWHEKFFEIFCFWFYWVNKIHKEVEFLLFFNWRLYLNWRSYKSTVSLFPSVCMWVWIFRLCKEMFKFGCKIHFCNGTCAIMMLRKNKWHFTQKKSMILFPYRLFSIFQISVMYCMFVTKLWNNEWCSSIHRV